MISKTKGIAASQFQVEELLIEVQLLLTTCEDYTWKRWAFYCISTGRNQCAS